MRGCASLAAFVVASSSYLRRVPRRQRRSRACTPARSAHWAAARPEPRPAGQALSGTSGAARPVRDRRGQRVVARNAVLLVVQLGRLVQAERRGRNRRGKRPAYSAADRASSRTNPIVGAGAEMGLSGRLLRRRCTRPQERRLRGESDHQRDARFPRAERDPWRRRRVARPTEKKGVGLVLYADPSVVASRLERLRPRRLRFPLEAVVTQSGREMPASFPILSGAQTRIAAGGLLGLVEGRSFRRLVSFRVLLLRRSSVSVLVA